MNITIPAREVRIEATVQMPCEPRTLTAFDGIEFVAKSVTFEHLLLLDGFECNRIIVFGETVQPGLGYKGTDRTNLSMDSAPDWLPTPPDGWDLGVRIEAERRAIAAEVVSA